MIYEHNNGTLTIVSIYLEGSLIKLCMIASNSVKDGRALGLFNQPMSRTQILLLTLIWLTLHKNTVEIKGAGLWLFKSFPTLQSIK